MDRLEEVTWKEIRQDTYSANPTLAQFIDELSSNHKYPLIKARYPYGSPIIQKGMVQLPISEGNLLPLTHTDIPQSISKQLQYSPIPLFLVLKNSVEVFINADNRTIPLNLFKPGHLLGLFETVNYWHGFKSNPPWSVSAGARSIFMLPRANENNSLKRLCLEFDLSRTTRLNSLSDYWQVFKQIAQHSNFHQPWSCEVLFFTQPWLDQQSKTWNQFKNYLFKCAWEQAQFAIKKVEEGREWENFATTTLAKRFKLTPYLIDQVKHLNLIATGKWPGFRPADHNQEAAPIKGLEDVFIQVYGLKEYHPTIMHTCMHHIGNKTPVYYSLSFPTALEGTKEPVSASTIMLNLRNIKLMLETIQHNVTNNLNDNAAIQSIFEYFHVDDDIYGEIQSSKEIPKYDPAFEEIVGGRKDRTFCATSPFWRGCVRISSEDILNV